MHRAETLLFLCITLFSASCSTYAASASADAPAHVFEGAHCREQGCTLPGELKTLVEWHGHYTQSHTKKTPCPVDGCKNGPFQSKKALQKHYGLHHTGKGFKCTWSTPPCKRTFSSNFDLDHHLARHEGKVLICPALSCYKLSTCTGRLRAHIHAHAGYSEPTTYLCWEATCYYSCETANEFFAHVDQTGHRPSWVVRSALTDSFLPLDTELLTDEEYDIQEPSTKYARQESV